jgi:hypothetical protein
MKPGEAPQHLRQNLVRAAVEEDLNDGTQTCYVERNGETNFTQTETKRYTYFLSFVSIQLM